MKIVSEQKAGEIQYSLYWLSEESTLASPFGSVRASLYPVMWELWNLSVIGQAVTSVQG